MKTTRREGLNARTRQAERRVLPILKEAGHKTKPQPAALAGRCSSELHSPRGAGAMVVGVVPVRRDFPRNYDSARNMTRAELIEEWNRLVDADVSIARVHEWSDPLVRANETSEPLVMTGLQTLHGVTGSASGATLGDIARLRDAWLIDCDDYDADPVAWRRSRAQWTLRGLSRDHPDKAPAAALVFLREGILTEQEVQDAVSGNLR